MYSKKDTLQIEFLVKIVYNGEMISNNSKFSVLGFITKPFHRWREHIHENKIIKNAVENLILNSKLEAKFFVMAIISGLMATIGILMEDVVILIAAMVLAPLLNPILAFAAGIVLGHMKLIWYATKGFFGGFLAIILVVAGFIRGLAYLNYDINIAHFFAKFESETSTLLLIIAAFLSGFAGVYSWLKSNGNGLNLVGVAIAVALIPLVSALGILLGLAKISAMGYLAGWFGFNLLSLILGAITAFVILGFRHPKEQINKDLKEVG